MLIHHYTNIESLALILQSRKIRFNRLDRMDDLEEGRVEAQGIPLAKYTYVSCWTESDDESIPLWHMYSGNGNGVRISLPQDMFKDYSIMDGLIGDKNLSATIQNIFPKITPSILWKIPSSEYSEKKYLILPIYSNNLTHFYRKIQYVDDVFSHTNNLDEITYHNNGTYDLSLKMGEVGIYKHNRWQFQNESRFIIQIIPTEQEITLLDAQKSVEFIIKALMNKSQPHFETYDLSLKDEAFEQLEVTLSPSITSGQRVIVDSLVKHFAPNAKIKDSELTHCVKLKN